MTEEETQPMPENVLNYTDKFLETKPIHKEIEKILIAKKNILDSQKLSQENTFRTFNDASKLIDDDLEDNKDLYRRLPILSTHLPNYTRAEKNWMMLVFYEKNILVDTIIELVKASNNIKETVRTETVYPEEPSKKTSKKKKEPEKNMDEQSKLSFQNKVRDFIIIMRDTSRKPEYESTRNKIQSMIDTKEQLNLVDNISREFLGKELKEAKYTRHWEKVKNAKKM